MPPSVTNAQVLAAIDALARQQQQQIEAYARQQQQRDEQMEEGQHEVAVTLVDMTRRITALENAWTKEARRDACPFRDDIVAAANNKRRIETLEGAVHKVELQVVKWGALGGGVISTVVAVVDRLIEAWRAGGGA